MSILCLLDRPALPALLERRGFALSGPVDLVIAALSEVRGLRRLRRAWPERAILAVAPDDASAVRLLDARADDVATLDRDDAIIAARAAAILMRRAPATLRIGDLAVDRIAHRASRNGRPLDLLPREYALLLHLVRHAGVTVTRADLLEAVWGLDFAPGTNVIEVHVSRLRARLDRGFAAPMLLTDKGRGYRLVAPQPEIEGTARAV